MKLPPEATCRILSHPSLWKTTSTLFFLVDEKGKMTIRKREGQRERDRKDRSRQVTRRMRQSGMKDRISYDRMWISFWPIRGWSTGHDQLFVHRGWRERTKREKNNKKNPLQSHCWSLRILFLCWIWKFCSYRIVPWKFSHFYDSVWNSSVRNRIPSEWFRYLQAQFEHHDKGTLTEGRWCVRIGAKSIPIVPNIDTVDACTCFTFTSLSRGKTKGFLDEGVTINPRTADSWENFDWILRKTNFRENDHFKSRSSQYPPFDGRTQRAVSFFVHTHSGANLQRGVDEKHKVQKRGCFLRHWGGWGGLKRVCGRARRISQHGTSVSWSFQSGLETVHLRES